MSFKRFLIGLVGLGLALSSVESVFAARPFLTEDAPTTPPGVVGVEIGVDAKDPCGDVDSGLVVYAGVCDSAEIYAELPFIIKSNTPDVAGKIDVFNVGGKWNFLKCGDEQILTIAASISNLPKETSLWSYQGMLVFSKSLVSDLTLHTNFGGNFSSEKFESYLWGVGLEKQLSQQLALAAEIHSADTIFSERAFADSHITSMLGVAWSLSEKATLDLSLRFPLTEKAKALNDNNEPTELAHYVVGLTYEF